jgi:hypothetical protein
MEGDTVTWGVFRSRVEPFVDCGDMGGGLVADGQLVVAGGDGAVALEPADAAFHGVALLVQLGSMAGGRLPARPLFFRLRT